ncbi:MAG: 4-(cytidine 5'-diphospho)-2-C-methyl-D-erythritol kinase [Thermoanaerobaculaceae bacterium]
MRLHVRCPAKINLHLQVLGRRPDGYHELRTLFAAVGVWDDLWFEEGPAGTVELTVEPAGAVPDGSDNLAVKAARALSEKMGRERGARIALRKQIPVAGGLGGGSANAAAALVGLVKLWGLSLEPSDLLSVAGSIGADVPFFLVGGVAWGVGRGSEVMPVRDLPPWWVVLVPGPNPVPTAEVYRALNIGALDGEADVEIYRWVEKGGELPIGRFRNDLQPMVVRRWPEVTERLRRVNDTRPLLAMLSGSGGTVFGLYRGEDEATRAAEFLAAFRPLAAPILTREASVLRPSAAEG